MSEQLPEGITRAEFNELQQSVRSLADALRAREEADTAAETQAAQEDVTEARADLDAVAKDLGIPAAKLRQAAENAKREEELERLRPLVTAILDEVIESPPAEGQPEDDPDEEPASDPAAPSEEPAGDPPAADPEPEDTAPTQAHWSERTVGELLGK